MKRIYLYGVIAALGAATVGCDDFINENRMPLSQQVADPSFWNSEVNVTNQINYFYECFLGYGNGTGYGDFYFVTATDDQSGTVGGEFRDWRVPNVPASSSDWNDPYEYIRRANDIITNLERTDNTMDAGTKPNYIGIARMIRAYEYYRLVRAYGDVPYVTIPLSTADEAELFGPRTARATVMDNCLEDLNYAIDHIATEKNATQFSQDLARAIKAEVCLFEGSYARYVAKDNTRADKYFGEVVDATTPLLAKYKPGSDYAALYQSINGALASNPEIIFCKQYLRNVFMHATIDYTCGSTPIAGMTKDAFDAYLFTDGKPLAAQADAQDLAKKSKVDRWEYDDETEIYKKSELETLSIEDALAVRDKRLAATIYDCVMYKNFPYKAINPTQQTDKKKGYTYYLTNTSNMTSTTGYGIRKYRYEGISLSDATTANKSYTDAPLYWGAFVALAYAEAKAELGTFDDAAFAISLKPLYDRAGLGTAITGVNDLISMNDPANNMGVSSLLWEIRRCRRCELMFDRDIRYWDLVRWNQLKLMATIDHPNTVLGAHIPADATVSYANVNGYLNPAAELYGNKQRAWDEKYNLYPIPSGQIQLNKQLKQNSGWQ